MRFHILPLLALAATVTAQDTEPKISAEELTESIVAITEAVQDAVEMTSDIPSEAEAVKTFSKDMVDIGRGSSVAVQALPRPGKSNGFKYPEEKQEKLCGNLEKLIEAGFSLVDGLESTADKLPQTPEFKDPIKFSVGFMGKALGGLVRRTALVTDCDGVDQGRAGELRQGFEKAVGDF